MSTEEEREYIRDGYYHHRKLLDLVRLWAGCEEVGSIGLVGLDGIGMSGRGRDALFSVGCSM